MSCVSELNFLALSCTIPYSRNSFKLLQFSVIIVLSFVCDVTAVLSELLVVSIEMDLCQIHEYR